MAETQLPKDLTDRSVQVLAPDVVDVIATTATSARITLTNPTEIVMLSVIEAVWVAFGDGAVVAVIGTDAVSFLIPGGGVTVAVPAGATHVAAIRDNTNGKLCIAKLL